MADVVQWHSRRVAACVRWSHVNRRRRNRKRWKNRKICTKPYISRNPSLGAYSPSCSIFVCLLFVSLYAGDEISHKSGQLWISSMNGSVASRWSSPSAILESVTQITWIERVLLLVDSYQHTFVNRSHVKYEFTNTNYNINKAKRALWLAN